MDNDLMVALTDIKADQRLIFSKIDAIDEKMGKLPCPVNTYKITLLQRIVFAGIAVILFAFMTGLVNDREIPKKIETQKIAQVMVSKEEAAP